ncbi:hypothetical protein C0389_00040 [bacterium]|nr:hypothetical protein [bacterium]
MSLSHTPEVSGIILNDDCKKDSTTEVSRTEINIIALYSIVNKIQGGFETLDGKVNSQFFYFIFQF